MNKIFEEKKTNKIVLDEEYYLEPDGWKGLVLIREFPKIRKKINKETKVETEETYIANEKYFYPKLSQVLDKYLELTVTESNSIQELKDIVLRVEQAIQNLK